MNMLLMNLTHDICHAEIIGLDTKTGPLSQFPHSVNTNIFADIVRFAIEKAPKTIQFLFDFLVKKGQSVRPQHVIKLATLFANLCFTTNKNLNALIQLRSLTMHVDKLTDSGLDILSCQNLAETARSLCNLRDSFSAVGPMLSLSLASTMTSQSAVDNCDVCGEHLTVEYVMHESRSPTVHLDTSPKTKADTLKLITLDTRPV